MARSPDRPILQPCLDSLRQRAEIGDALQLIIGQLNVEVLLEAREQAQGLKAVDAEFLEEVVVGREALARHLELRGSEVEDLVGRLLLGSHGLYYGKYGCASVLSTNFFSPRSVAGSANSSQKMSISRRSSS
jgi:hypothetical protein